MNLENMKKLRSQIERLPEEKFEMNTWIDHEALGCGTVACLAGWASILNGGPQEGSQYWLGQYAPVPMWTKEWLDLDEMQAEWLFFGHWARGWDDKALALKALDHLIAGGSVLDVDGLWVALDLEESV